MKIFKKLEETFAAVAFAEAGEFETAREMIKNDSDDINGSGASNNTHIDMTETPSEA